MSIVGFDDLPVAAWPLIQLTTVAFDLDAMARRAASLLVRRIEAEEPAPYEHAVFTSRLVRRGDPGRRPVAARASAGNGLPARVHTHTLLITGHSPLLRRAMPLDPIAYKPYADPDDFIREVTDLIWVNRAIGYIRENYEPDSIVHGAYGTSVGRDEVIQGTLMRISDTPDRIGQAEDVIWEARGDDAFLSSHLVLSVDPQQRRGQPHHRQLPLPSRPDGRGVGGARLAGHRAAAGSGSRRARSDQGVPRLHRQLHPAGPADVIAVGDSGPRPDDFRPEVEMVLEFIQRVWNDRDLEKVDDFFVRDLVLHTVGNRTIIRPEGYRRAAAADAPALPGRAVRGPRRRDQLRRALRGTADRRAPGSSPAATTVPPTSGRSPAPRSTCSASRSSWSRTAGSCGRSGSTTRSRCAPRSPPGAATCRTPAPTSTDRRLARQVRNPA